MKFCLSFIFLIFVMPVLNLREKADLKQAEIYSWLKTVSEVTSLVENRSFRNVKFENFFQDALRSAVAKIDAHSSFIVNYEEMTDALSGNFAGVGLHVLAKSPSDDSMLIIDVVENSPSFKVGILPGDRILAVDEKQVKDLSANEVVAKMKGGKRGSKVWIKVLRNKKSLDFEVTRDVIQDDNSCCYYFSNQKIYYVGFRMFSEDAPRQVKSIIEKINTNQESKGLILDLRNNPGGILDSAVEIASLFLPKKSLIVTTKNNMGETVSSYSTKRDPIWLKNVPVFILTNNFTASAAEILAGCLRYHSALVDGKKKRPMIFVLGTTTHGKGSVQEVVPVSNGCALSLTSMLYFLPENYSVQAQGIKPDFLIQQKSAMSREMRWVHELYGHEKAMKHHITQSEVDAVLQGKDLDFASELDKEEGRRLQKLEVKKDMEDNQDKNDFDDSFLYSDVGSLFEQGGAVASEKKADEQVNDFESKKVKALGNDYQIQTAVNMLSSLSFAQQHQKDLLEGRDRALNFLQESFVLDNNLAATKVKC